MTCRYRFGLLGIVSIASILGGCAAPFIIAGVGTGAIMAEDRRTNGAFVEDEMIENKIQYRINQRFGYSVHVNAVSFNHNVLIAGQVPNQEAVREVEMIAKDVEHVNRVYNETQIAPSLSLATRSSDSYITSKVKARYVDASRFSPTHIKVYTEDGTVFLMGIVTREEADVATDIARSTDGVKRVVRLFEYGTRERVERNTPRRSDDYPPRTLQGYDERS